MTLPDATSTPTISVAAAGALCGLGRSKAYEEARRWITTGGAAGLPAIEFGRTLRCPTAKVLELLGLGPPMVTDANDAPRDGRIEPHTTPDQESKRERAHGTTTSPRR